MEKMRKIDDDNDDPVEGIEIDAARKKDALGFEWIAGMTAEFVERMSRAGMGSALTPEEASYWQLRILLSIAQQLSVFVAVVKERG